MLRRALVVGALILSFAFGVHAQVRINEVLPDDNTILADEDGDRPGWIEILNVGPTPLDLAGYGLTDDPLLPFKWTFPQLTLEPGTPLVVFASGKNRTEPPDSPSAIPDPPAAFSPANVPGLVWWLDAAEPGSFVFEQDRVREWHDRSGRRPVDDIPPVLDPADVAGKSLWLDAADASSFTLVGGLVSEWQDKSGRARHARASNGSRRPSYVTANAEHRAAVRFDGDDVLEFDRLHDVRTVIWVGLENQVVPESYRPLIGDRFAYDFARGIEGQILGTYAGMAPGALWGRTFVNGSAVDPLGRVLPGGLNVVSILTSSAVSAGNLSSDRLLPGRAWWGEVAELILFDRVLLDAELRGLERHLRGKWGTPSPPVADFYHARQEIGALQPRLVHDPLTGFPAVEFDGVDDVLAFPTVSRLRTIFWVVREDDDSADSFRPLLGDVGSGDFVRGDDGLIFNSSNPATWVNGQPVDPITTRIPRGRVLVNVAASRFCRASTLASDRGLADRVWAGQVMEVVAYDRGITDAERLAVQNHLSRKWFLPSHNLHANFRLQEDGERVQLTRPDRSVADLTPVLETRADTSFGRVSGGNQWAWFATPTPGAANTSDVFPAGLSPKPEFLPTAPFFTGSIQVSFVLTNLLAGSDIHFTTDGNAPDAPGVDAVWMEDAAPPGAQLLALGSAPWNWRLTPTPYSGATALQSGASAALHQLIVSDIPNPPTVNVGESLVAYVRLDPANPPQEVMLQWHSAGSWSHRAYWGANLIESGTDGTISRRHMGALPVAGQWTRLEIPAEQLGLEGAVVDGVAFTLFGGQGSFDHVGKTTFAGQVYKSPVTLTQSTALRAQTRSPGRVPSRIVAASYVVAPAGGLPVLSLTTSPENLFSPETGIYVDGATTNPDGSEREPNWNRTWERPAHVEWVEPDGQRGFSLNCGVKIHGAYTRAWPQKSLRLHFRSRYGDPELNYPVFPGNPVTEFETLIIRNGGNDWNIAYLRDPLAQALGAELGILHQARRPVQVFINGKYWGIQDVRERPDDRFIASHEFLDPARLDVIKNESQVEGGDASRYLTFLSQVASRDLSDPAQFETVASSLDLGNYTDWLITEIYGGNQDWPGNNVLMWRSRDDLEPWRWVLVDLDGCFDSLGDGPSVNTLAGALRDRPDEGLASRSLAVMRGLMENPGYRLRFLSRFADLLNSTFSSEHATATLQALHDQLAPAMPGQIARWGNPPPGFPRLGDVGDWEGRVAVIRNFVQQRPAILRQQLAQFFQVSALAELRLIAPASPGLAELRVGSLRLSPAQLPWSGQYFHGVPVELVVVPEVGFLFDGWSDGQGGKDPHRTWIPNGNLSLAPRLIVDDGVDLDGLVPKPHDLRLGSYEFGAWSGNSAAGTYPPAMLFQQTSLKDPGLSAELEGVWNGRYDLTSRSRIRGLGGDGISFVNTSDAQPDEGFLGGALLALRTTGVKHIQVLWTGATVTPNTRAYALRLQWRAGTNGPFADVPGSQGQPVEYRQQPEPGHASILGPVMLPAGADNRPVIQLRWKYYLADDTATGPRAELRLDDISVSGELGPGVIPAPFPISTTFVEGQWRVQANVTPGAICSLHTSTDLVHWTKVDARIVGADGLLAFDFAPDDAAARFFQVHSP